MADAVPDTRHRNQVIEPYPFFINQLTCTHWPSKPNSPMILHYASSTPVGYG